MRFGMFTIVEPGLTYSQRLSFPADAGLSLDPLNTGCPIEGEWLGLNVSQALFRADATQIQTLSIAYPLLVDKGRMDVQSGRRLTVLAHKGATCQTSVFATKDGADGAITYAAGDLLTLCRYIEDAAQVIHRIGVCPLVPADTDGGTVDGAIVQANLTGDAGANPLRVARVVRPPYTQDRRSVMDIEIL